MARNVRGGEEGCTVGFNFGVIAIGVDEYMYVYVCGRKSA